MKDRTSGSVSRMASERTKAMAQVRLFQALFLGAVAVGIFMLAAVDGGTGVAIFLVLAGLLGFFVLVGVVGYVKAGRKS